MMADSVDRVFVHALNTVKRLPRTGSARPPDADRLKLYGLYKQSMEGDVDGTMAKPDAEALTDADGVSEIEKWESWKANNGISQTEAKRQYITTLIETMRRYATTTSESRELVAELEFVWNQIKSNPISSESSPGRPSGVQRTPQSSVAQYRGRDSRLISRDGLRVLRPYNYEVDDDGVNSDVEVLDTSMYGDRGVLDDSLRSKVLSSHKPSKSPIEKALIRMTTEIAALREQMEARNFGTYQLRSHASAWAMSAVFAMLRHLMINMTLLGFLLLWARRSRDPMVSNGYRLLMTLLKQKLQNM